MSESVTLVRFCVPPPVRFCVPPFAFIIYNPTMELGGVLVPTYRNRVVIFLSSEAKIWDVNEDKFAVLNDCQHLWTFEI